MVTYIIITFAIVFTLVYLGFKLNKRSQSKKANKFIEEVKKATDMTRVASSPYLIKTLKYGQNNDSKCTINGIHFEEFNKVIISYGNKTGEVTLIHSGNTEWKVMDFYGMSIPLDEKVKTIRRKVGK